jgi:general secretion pathway protein I
MPGTQKKRNRAPSGGHARGFTLLEMIVATALMAIAVVGLLSLLSATLSNAARVQQYDRAAMLARTKMNELLVLSPLPLGRALSGQWDASTGWTARAEVFERPPNAQRGNFQLVRIDLEVWWTADDQRKSVTLEGFRRTIIRDLQ